MERREVNPPLGMVYVPAGAFLYGEDNVETYVDAFYLDIYPVTNRQFKQFLDSTNFSARSPRDFLADWRDSKYPEGRSDYPVTWISWNDAAAYAEWAGKRLPTNEEWEKAARGVDGRPYPWGDELDDSRCNCEESNINDRTPVGRYEKGRSPYGCYDMAGNVWEWTSSWYETEEGEKYRILRGGAHSYFDYPSTLTFLTPIRYSPEDRLDLFGFRCAIDAP